MKVHINIGIDCAPGAVRPDAYIEDALKICGVEYTKQEPILKLFGAWRWVITTDSNIDKDLDVVQKELKNYFDDLYNKGYIRGAEYIIDSVPEDSIQIRGFFQIKMFVSDLDALEDESGKALTGFGRSDELFEILTSDPNLVNIPKDIIRDVSEYLGVPEQRIIDSANKFRGV